MRNKGDTDQARTGKVQARDPVKDAPSGAPEHEHVAAPQAQLRGGALALRDKIL